MARPSRLSHWKYGIAIAWTGTAAGRCTPSAVTPLAERGENGHVQG